MKLTDREQAALASPLDGGDAVVLAAVVRRLLAEGEAADCPLAHVQCGACGCSIALAGTCGCPEISHPAPIAERDRIFSLRKKVERLQATIGNLPKLADGTIPFPSMEVFWLDFGRVTIRGPWVVVNIEVAGCLVEQSAGVRILRAFSGLYGTREAVEAARKESP